MYCRAMMGAKKLLSPEAKAAAKALAAAYTTGDASNAVQSMIRDL
ncbi:hypothetical protein KIPB_016401, partial [Kipferlia bialata]|eukprot:g16401.t1